MKMAVILDQLFTQAGTERVAQAICEEFREADVLTLAYNPELTFPYFRGRGVRTTWLNPLVRSHRAFRWSFPIATYVMQSVDLREYDVVLSCSATVAKYVRVPNGKHICYCYIPTRALWHSGEYFGNSATSLLVKPLMAYLRRRDFLAAQAVDQFIAISQDSRQYIARYYQRDALVLHCPIELEKFHPGGEKKDHFLIVSRLEAWKKTEYAIEAFNRLGWPLRIIGYGPEEQRLRRMAGATITFLGGVDDETLAREYREARAVVFTPSIEYGLIPLEANASGTPVICLGLAGVRETMSPANEERADGNPATAVFFYEQSADALVTALKQFADYKFDPQALASYASRWSVPGFQREIRRLVESFVGSDVKSASL